MAFDDTITISYKDFNNEWYYHEYDCTTDPGTHWVENLLNSDGVGNPKTRSIQRVLTRLDYIKENIGMDQQKPLKVYRDGDLDNEYDLIEENVKEGIYGINIHKCWRNWVVNPQGLINGR